MKNRYRDGIERGFKEAFSKHAQYYIPPQTPPPMGRREGYMAGGLATGAVLGGLAGRRAGATTWNILNKNKAPVGLSPKMNTRWKMKGYMGGRGALLGALGGLAVGHLANKHY